MTVALGRHGAPAPRDDSTEDLSLGERIALACELSRMAYPSRKRPARRPAPSLPADFRDLLGLFESEGVEFLLVGGLALAVHAEPRATKDMDLWVRASPENARRLATALAVEDRVLEVRATKRQRASRTVSS